MYGGLILTRCVVRLTLPSHRLNKQRPELVAMVQRQRDRWPWTDKRRKFNPSKTRYDDLKAALLDPNFGFTTSGPSTASNADGDATDGVEGTQPARRYVVSFACAPSSIH
jgi:hypothetical protein